MQKIHRTFSLPVEEAAFRRRVESLRVLFGLILFYRVADILGFAAVVDGRPGIVLKCAEAVLSLCVAAGFLTPLALAGLLVLFARYPSAWNLGYQVATIDAWGLLFLGAGRFHGIDAWLSRRSRIGRRMERLYAFSRTVSDDWPWIRFLMILLFWGINVSAIVFHAADRLWLKGEVLQLVLATPYLTDHYPLFTAWRDSHPFSYDLFGKVALAVQCVWELFLLPLMFWKWGRRFVKIQGLVFFVFSLFFLNLEYLPLFELLWWLLLFGHPSRSESAAAEAKKPSSALRIVLVLSGVVCLLQTSRLALEPLAAPDLRDRVLSAVRFSFRFFGQWAVNVFNKKDLEMGAVYFILYEVGADGSPVRVVPYLDRWGGRLDYLRNDYLYFGYSLPWQRLEKHEKFEDPDFRRPTEGTLRLVQSVADFDACLMDPFRSRRYRAEFFFRTMDHTPDFYVWTEPQSVATIDAVSGEGLKKRCSFAFDLPPGHFGSARRQAKTLEALRTGYRP